MKNKLLVKCKDQNSILSFNFIYNAWLIIAFTFLQQPVLVKGCGEISKGYRPYCCLPEGFEVSFLFHWTFRY